MKPLTTQPATAQADTADTTGSATGTHPQQQPPAAATEAPESPAADSSSADPHWAAFKDQVRKTPWPQIDRSYLAFAAAMPRDQLGPYADYLKQTRDKDANLRANGVVGIAASNPKAAASRLAKLLSAEPDPHNRTIIVWCLRYIATLGIKDAPEKTLWDFLASAKDVDYGLCLDPSGQVVRYPPPFPLAGVEAFKGLIALKGAAYMLDGPGWRHLMDRVSKNIDPEPLQLDWERLRPETRPRETEQQTMERLMREMDKP